VVCQKRDFHQVKYEDQPQGIVGMSDIGPGSSSGRFFSVVRDLIGYFCGYFKIDKTACRVFSQVPLCGLSDISREKREKLLFSASGRGVYLQSLRKPFVLLHRFSHHRQRAVQCAFSAGFSMCIFTAGPAELFFIPVLPVRSV
jgi:hypothetical protein